MAAAPNDEFSRFTNDLYSTWEKSMTAWWDTVLDSPEFLGASGKGLSAMAQARKQYESQVEEQLSRMHLATRGDLTRLARIANLLEERVLQMEDTLLEAKDLLKSQARAMDALQREVVQARIEAAEARLEQRERLATLQDELAGLRARVDAAEPKRSAKKGD